ncbi:putative glycoside hydrolase family 15 protein [Knoellia locipacati]|uniref:putative glycoside hydrolase n=1 Tax=Knoellia locipacati TaxID=882824 RepID=UPI00384FD139
MPGPAASRGRDRSWVGLMVCGLLVVVTAVLVMVRLDDPAPKPPRASPSEAPRASPSEVSRAGTGRFVDTWDGIHLGLTLGSTVLDPSVEQPRTGRKVGYVWSAPQPHPVPSRTLDEAHLGHYLAATWNDVAGTDEPGHSLRWFQQNRPDWVAYRCENGRATTTPAWYGYGTGRQWNRVPLDWSNPEVQTYLIEHAKAQLAKGYDGISLDNVLFTNFQGVCGTYQWVDAGGKRSLAWRSLGYPATNTSNPKLVADLRAFLARLSRELRTAYPDRTLMANTSALIAGLPVQNYAPYFDGVLDEIGFMGQRQERVTDDAWLTQVRQAEALSSMGKAYVAVAYANGGGAVVTGAARESVVSWALSNYLLVKGRHSFTYVHRLAPGFVDLPEYDVPIGHPTGPRTTRGGTHQRRYSGGLVIVNPSSTSSAEVVLHEPMTDSAGRVLSVARLEPASGVVLLDRSGR